MSVEGGWEVGGRGGKTPPRKCKEVEFIEVVYIQRDFLKYRFSCCVCYLKEEDDSESEGDNWNLHSDFCPHKVQRSFHTSSPSFQSTLMGICVKSDFKKLSFQIYVGFFKLNFILKFFFLFFYCVFRRSMRGGVRNLSPPTNPSPPPHPYPSPTRGSP